MNIVDIEVVWLPNHVPYNCDLEQTTDTKRGLKFKNIMGLPCGHVPRGSAPAFRYILDCGGTIEAQAIGDPIPSFLPWPAVKEDGGGVVIPCNYFIYTQDLAVLKQHLSAMIEKDAMELI